MTKNKEKPQKDYMKDISESLQKLVALKIIELQGHGTIVKESDLLTNSQRSE